MNLFNQNVAPTLSKKEFQALQCPFCPNIFVESLWSLLSHFQISHKLTAFKPSIENLEKLKKTVPRSSVSIIRPAFTDNGEPSDFLVMLFSHFQSPMTENISAATKVNCFYSSEGCELGTVVQNSINSKSNFDVEMLRNKSEKNWAHQKNQTELLAQINSSHFIHQMRVPSFKNLNVKTQSANKDLSFQDLKLARKSSLTNQNHYLKTTVNTLMSNQSTTTSEISTNSLQKPTKRRLKSLADQPTTKYQQSNRKTSSMTKIVSLICSQCGLSFENRCKLTRHLIDHKMAQSPYRCPFLNCLQCYDSRMKYRSHLIRVHKQICEEEVKLFLEEGDKEVVRLREDENVLTVCNEPSSSNVSEPLESCGTVTDLLAVSIYSKSETNGAYDNTKNTECFKISTNELVAQQQSCLDKDYMKQQNQFSSQVLLSDSGTDEAITKFTRFFF